MDEAEAPVCPREVVANRNAIRLFLIYLKQPATRDAIMATAKDKERVLLANYLHTLAVSHEARTDEGLRRLITVAPALHALALAVLGVDVQVIPREARLPLCALDAALAEYHRWVQAQA